VFKAANGVPVGVVNLLGRVFMKEAECPFRTADAALAALKGQAKVVFVDFHAETTAEKVALGWHLDGRASAVVGTHTHVQTADDRLLPLGTAFVSDAGMTGGFDSVIGMDRTAALRRFLTLLPERLQPAGGDLRLNAVVVSVDEATGRATRIQRLQIPYVKGAKAGTAGARLLTGEEPASAVRIEAKLRAQVLIDAGVRPKLALVSVGDDPASQVYLKKKQEACVEAGITVERVGFPAGTSTDEVVRRVRQWAPTRACTASSFSCRSRRRPRAARCSMRCPPAKDVDGFHPENAGRLALGLRGSSPPPRSACCGCSSTTRSR
jgi:hypothetical protein